MSAGTDDVRYIRYLRRILWFTLAAGAATLGAIGAMLLTTGQAAAQPVSVPGIGVIEVPNEVQIPAGLMENLRLTPIAPAPHSSDVPRAGNPGAAPAPESARPAPQAFSFAPAPSAPAPDAAAALHPPVLPLPEFAARAVAPLADMLHLPIATPAPAVHAAPHKSTGERAAEAARSRIGDAYSYGSAGPDAFDCSGLVQWSYRQAGVDLPRTSYGQLDSGTPVSLNELKEGDMVSFYGGGHSAIYIGDGKVVHASTSGRGVVVSPISEMPVSGARRF